MNIIPCIADPALEARVKAYAEVLKTEAHRLGEHGLSEEEFYSSGVFRGAIEQVRGEFAATMGPKREFVRNVLAHMEDHGFIEEWTSSGGKNRHDYTVTLKGGRVCVIELKGCLDGNNSLIFDRPAHAEEFVIWSVCPSASSDLRKGVWSGLHTRLSAEVVEKREVVDGLVVWDFLCGTPSRVCPKLSNSTARTTAVGAYRLPPPCIYLLPGTVPSVRNNPRPEPNDLADVGFLRALHECFGGDVSEINSVQFEVFNEGADLMRRTTVLRAGNVVRQSEPTAIRRR